MEKTASTAVKPAPTTFQMSEESGDTSGKPTDQQQSPAAANAGNQGQGDAKPKQRRGSFKGKRKGKPGKIHIRLPPIEAYQKDLCFAAEAPGRVVVRLERLMGSDKIRPVDGKFMETLIQRLEDEEKIAWQRKIKLRKKAERERHRQLAIQGLMEPGPGMEDLYNHPVFRVNRILNRLNSLDNTFSGNPAQKLPAIVPIDPFEKDETGAFFKEYPAHRALRKECDKYKDKYPEQRPIPEENISTRPSKSQLVATKSSGAGVKSKKTVVLKAPAKQKSKRDKSGPPPLTKSSMPFPSSSTSVPATSLPSDLEEEDEFDEELLEEDLIPPAATRTELETEFVAPPEELTELEKISRQVDKEYMESLTALQDKYGVPKYAEFEEEWKPYQAEVIDRLDDFEQADELFEAARNVFEMYTRQDILTQQHISMNKDKPKRVPSDVKSSSTRKISASEAALESKAPSKMAPSAQKTVQSVGGEEGDYGGYEDDVPPLDEMQEIQSNFDISEGEEEDEEEEQQQEELAQLNADAELTAAETDEEEFQEEE